MSNDHMHEHETPRDAHVHYEPVDSHLVRDARPASSSPQQTRQADTDDVADMSHMQSANARPAKDMPFGSEPDDTKAATSQRDPFSQMKRHLRMNASRGADTAADVVSGMAHAGVSGMRNLPGVARRMATRVFGPVGVFFNQAATGVSHAMNISVGASRVALATFMALTVGSGGVLLASDTGFNQAWFSSYDECEWIVSAEASSRYGAAENKIPETLNGHPLGDAYTVCVNLDTYNYPNGSVQRTWQDKWAAAGREMTNELPTINGRYLVATTDKYGAMGDAIDFYLDDGTVIPCIRAEAKSEEETDYDHNPANEWGHKDGRCILEFQWCTGSGYDTYGTNPGQNYFEELNGHRVAGWTNRGSADGSNGSIIGGAGGATSDAQNKALMELMGECGQRATSADNSTAAAAMASICYTKQVTIGEGYTGSELYKKVHDEVTSYPGSYYCSCDFATTTAIRWSGADVDIPTNAAVNVHTYLMNSPKWQKVSDDAMNFDDIQPGDVCSTSGHVAMYIGGDIVDQVYESTLKGTDADLGKPKDSQVWGQASNNNGGNDNDPMSRPPCLDEGVSPAMEVYRCVNPDNSDKYNDIDIAGVTSSNSAAVKACECRIVMPEEKEQSPSEQIAELAVKMAATASPDDRIAGENGNPWKDTGDARLDNLIKIMDATVGAWGGNNAYASCVQAASAVIAATADPDIAPDEWPGSGIAWSEDMSGEMGGTGGTEQFAWYVDARPDIYQKVGDNPNEGMLQPGDILVSSTHVMIYVGQQAAQKKFSGTDANTYEASFADSTGECYFAGLTHRTNFSGFTVYRVRKVNDTAAHKPLNWQSMVS